MAILVTGGAGYIGSYTVRCLQQAMPEESLVVLDNLLTGNRWAVPSEVTFVEGQVGDAALLQSLFEQYRFTSVMHFAAFIDVAESVSQPFRYFQNNTLETVVLMEACVQHGISQFVFSSTAAVYRSSHLDSNQPLYEMNHLEPISPYGSSKLATEFLLRGSPIHVAILRYFNVAGAAQDLSLGQSYPRSLHLVTNAAQAALGHIPQLKIFGTDYPTHDGTCIRDYIHVEDLARAHVLVLQHLRKNPSLKEVILNCGGGVETSVREVIETMKHVSGQKFHVVEVARRPGDAPYLVADIAKIQKELGWQPKHSQIEKICRSAYLWEQKALRQKGR